MKNKHEAELAKTSKKLTEATKLLTEMTQSKATAVSKTSDALNLKEAQHTAKLATVHKEHAEALQASFEKGATFAKSMLSR